MAPKTAPEPTVRTFKDVIKDAREELGLTQDDVADKLGVTQPAVSMWENGRSRPTADVLVALADLLKLDVAQLLRLRAVPA